jgi:LysM repeat protein
VKTSITNLILVLATVASLLIASSAFAGGAKKNGGNSTHQNGGVKITFGGNPPGNNQNLNRNNCNNNNCNNNNCNNQNCGGNLDNASCDGGLGNSVVGGQPFEPFHSTYLVQPGDTFSTVSSKEYGNTSNAKYIARFNRLVLTSALVAGQRLVLPAISANGQLTPSRSPAADGDVTPTALQSSTSTFSTRNLTTGFSGSGTTTPTTNNKPAPTEPRTKLTVGSTLLVDGQTFGEKPGVARLRVNGLSLPIEVLEWTTSAVKIRLPKIEATTGTFADIEVLRADGNLASKSAVELTAASVQVATRN